MYLAARGPRDPEGQEGERDLLELKESQVLPACLEETGSLALREHRVHQASGDQWDQLESRDQEDYQDQLGHQGHQDYQGSTSVVQ